MVCTSIVRLQGHPCLPGRSHQLVLPGLTGGLRYLVQAIRQKDIAGVLENDIDPA